MPGRARATACNGLFEYAGMGFLLFLERNFLVGLRSFFGLQIIDTLLPFGADIIRRGGAIGSLHCARHAIFRRYSSGSVFQHRPSATLRFGFCKRLHLVRSDPYPSEALSGVGDDFKVLGVWIVLVTPECA